MTIGLAACGGGDDGGSPAPAGAAATPTPQTSPTQPAPAGTQQTQANPPAQQTQPTPQTPAIPPDAQNGAPIVAANRVPTISGAAPTSAPPGNIYAFRPTAHDPDGHALTYSIAGKPTWAAFDASTGELRGIPSLGDVGKYEPIEIRASDGQHTVSLAPFHIDVRAEGQASITLNWLPPTQSASGAPLVDLAGYKIYWGTKLGDYTNQVTLKSPGIASYVLEHLAPGTYFIVLTAFNSRGEESGFSNTISDAL